MRTLLSFIRLSIGGFYRVAVAASGKNTRAKMEQDFATSASGYRKVDGRERAEAQANLWGRNAKGQGVPRNYAEAMRWCSRAAAQEQGEAQKLVREGPTNLPKPK